MPKWDDKAERDLLLAMRMAEHGANPISKETWVKAEKLMREMGHNDATVSDSWRYFLLVLAISRV